MKAGSIIPKYPVRLSVSDKKDETLILECYGESAEYHHYQDNGEDFKYQDGEYNLYRFCLGENGVKTEMIHHGYEKNYGHIEVKIVK